LNLAEEAGMIFAASSIVFNEEKTPPSSYCPSQCKNHPIRVSYKTGDR